MYKLEINLLERKKQIKKLFEAGFITAGTYANMLKEIRNEEQVGAIEYEATDDEMNYYWN